MSGKVLGRQIDSRALREVNQHETQFYQHSRKDEEGLAHATAMYWNTDPPTLASEFNDDSFFDAEFGDVGRYSISGFESSDDFTHLFNRQYCNAHQESSRVRSVKPTPDYDLIRSWLRHCDANHEKCCPDGNTKQLEIITVIDVRTKRLIPYVYGMKYMALSYVWGRKSLGEPMGQKLPANLPATIRQALAVATIIGVPFLWIDTMCINQSDAEKKMQQINMMDYIYEQAYGTIIALGEHADSGLPGVEDGPKRTPQLIAEFGPVKLLSRCPTLPDELENSKWPTRGWTFQEGLFSRRCIFFSPHQVYFHCNMMFCAEDSPDMLDYVPNESRGFRDFGYRRPDIKYMSSHTMLLSQIQGTHGSSEDRMSIFATFLQEYVLRDISFDVDSLNAFCALLSRLQHHAFRRGFTFGIPFDDFCEGLLWKPQAGALLEKRTGYEYPSWSWAAWKFVSRGIAFNYNFGYDVGIAPPPPLTIWLNGKIIVTNERAKRNHNLENIQAREIDTELRKLWEEIGTNAEPDPAEAELRQTSLFDQSLFIDGVVMTLPPIRGDLSSGVSFDSSTDLSELSADYPSALDPSPNRERRDFLVVQTKLRAAPQTYLELGLILLRWHENLAKRDGVLTCRIKEDLHRFWEYVQPRRKRFWLG